MDRPFRTIDQQVEILRSRGLSVDDRARAVLQREGYYCVVNGHKRPLLEAVRPTERYAAGSKFDDLHRLFVFDRDLRMTMFRYFAQAEAVLKAVCAYRFSERFQDEREPYLNSMNYRQDGPYRTWAGHLINDFKKILHKNPYGGMRFKREYIEHYVLNHDETPFWVLANHLTMGQIFKFYDYQTESMRNRIAKDFAELWQDEHGKHRSVSPRRLRLAYDHIKDFRNICAHDERLYCARVSPSKDIGVADLLQDLELVLTREEDERMRSEVFSLLQRIASECGGKTAHGVMSAMGVTGAGPVFLA